MTGRLRLARARGRVAVAVVLATQVLHAVPASGVPGPSAPCQVIGFSPNFARDHTALCAHQDWRNQTADALGQVHSHLGPITTYLTVDAGRTWRKTAGAGLPGPSDDQITPALTQVVFSATFATDHAIYLWAAADNLLRSTDLGASWTELATPVVTGDPGVGRMTPLGIGQHPSVDGPGEPTASALAYAFDAALCVGARAPLDAIITWPVATPATGSDCDMDVQFLAAPGWPDEPALLIATRPAESAGGMVSVTDVWTCNAVLDCRTRLTRRLDSTPDQAWLSPAYYKDRTIYLSVWESARRRELRLIRSTDAGRTWGRWPAVDALLRGRTVRTLDLATSPDGRRLTLRVSGDVPRSLEHVRERDVPPGGDGERIFVSTDAGRHWSLLGYAPAFNRAGRATLPFNAPYGYHTDEGGIWDVGGRLFTLAEHDTERGVENAGVWCSVDRGAHWAPRCP